MPRTTQTPAASAQPTAGDIARRAFELFCQRGAEHGHDLEDWLEAERELRQTSGFTAA